MTQSILQISSMREKTLCGSYLEYEQHPRRQKIIGMNEKGRGLKGMNLAQNLAQTKEKLCKVIPNYAENVNKNTITEVLQNCCKC